MRFVLYVLGLAASNLSGLVVTAVFGDPGSYPRWYWPAMVVVWVAIVSVVGWLEHQQNRKRQERERKRQEQKRTLRQVQGLYHALERTEDKIVLARVIDGLREMGFEQDLKTKRQPDQS